MQIATYDQWLDLKILHLRNQIADGATAPKWKCTECCGEGTITDTGEITGQEFEADCPECDGDGTVDFDPGSADKAAAKKVLTKAEYFNELYQDLIDVAQHTKQNEWLVLAEHGFTATCDLRTKRVEINHKDSFWYKSLKVTR